MANENRITARACLGPLPETQRGYGIHIDAHLKAGLLLHANAEHVILRSLENPSFCDLFSEHKTAKVTVAKISPNGEWIASGDESGRVLVWGRHNKIIKNDVRVGRKVLDIGWSDDSARIVAVGDGAEAKGRVFPRDSSNSIGDLIGHSKAVLSCAFKPSRPYKIVTSSEDNTICFHNGPPFKFDSSFQGHERYPNCVRFSPSGNHIVSVGSDSRIFVFDGNTNQKLREIESKDNGHKGSIFAVAFNADGTKILTVSGDKTAKIWNFETGVVETTFRFPDEVEHMQVGCAWAGDYIITVSLSGAINFLDIAKPDTPKFVVQGHMLNVESLAVEQKGGFFYTSDASGNIAKWTTGDKPTATWFSHKGPGKPICSIALNASGNVLVSCSFDDKVRLNAADKAVFGDNLLTPGGMPFRTTCSKKDPDLCIVGVAQGKLVTIRKGAIAQTLAIKYKPKTMDLSHDDSQLAVGGDDKAVHIYNLKGDALTEVATLKHHGGSVEAVAYSPDGAYLASSDSAREVFVLDAKDNYKPKTPHGWTFHAGKVTCLAWSPSGKYLASGAADQSIFIWDDFVGFNTGKRRIIENSHVNGPVQIGYISENELVSVGSDRTIRIWKL